VVNVRVASAEHSWRVEDTMTVIQVKGILRRMLAPLHGMASGGEETGVTRDMSGDPASVCAAIRTEGLAHQFNNAFSVDCEIRTSARSAVL
jgi:hypothetical protein